jgi:hypothetical protein
MWWLPILCCAGCIVEYTPNPSGLWRVVELDVGDAVLDGDDAGSFEFVADGTGAVSIPWGYEPVHAAFLPRWGDPAVRYDTTTWVAAEDGSGTIQGEVPVAGLTCAALTGERVGSTGFTLEDPQCRLVTAPPYDPTLGYQLYDVILSLETY